MNQLKNPDSRHPNAVKLRERFHDLQVAGLNDIKFWYVGETGFNGTDGPTVDDLCAEAVSMLDAYTSKEYIDVAEKVK